MSLLRGGLRAGAGVVVAAVLMAGCAPFWVDGRTRTVEAVFTRTQNLFVGNDVKVLGLEVGEVVALAPDGPHVRVTMEITDPDVRVPADASATIKPMGFIGERFVQIDPPYDAGPELADGGEIPVERTAVPGEVDEFLEAYEQFFDALDPETVADLVDVLAETFAGQGGGINELVDEASTTLRILADASDDLVGIAAELGQLNETVATRADELESMIQDWSVVFRTLGEESETIVDGIGELQRLTVELRFLLDRHGEELVTDLEVLTTTMSTVERNLERVGTLALGGRKLFESGERIFEWPDARLALMERFTEIPGNLSERLLQRLAGVCLRTGIDDCAQVEFWEPIVPVMTCVEGVVPCSSAEDVGLVDALREAMGVMPDEAVSELEADMAERTEAERARQQRGAPAPSGPAPSGSAPDEPAPLLGGGGIDEPPTVRDRLSDVLEGR